MKPVKFASIPKCASKSLKVQGLSGGTNERPHMPICDYPEWEKYSWHAVLRGDDWIESWWHEAKKDPHPFTQSLGMRFEDITEDLAIFDKPPEIPIMDMGCGVHSWVPENFSEAFKPFHGRFQAFCYSIIAGDTPCTVVHIDDLDKWLLGHGFKAFHLNKKTV